MRKPVKIFVCAESFTGPKTTKVGTFERVFSW